MLFRRSNPDREHRRFYDRLVDREMNALHRTAYRLCGDRVEAEDLTQEVFISAWKSITTLYEHENVRPWLFRVLRNAWIDRLRKRARRPQLVVPESPPEDAAPEPVPVMGPLVDRAEWEEFFDAEVTSAMDELPEGERQVLFYVTFGELSYQEVADALECPIGTVMSRLHRARARLQKRLAHYAMNRGIIEREDRDHG